MLSNLPQVLSGEQVRCALHISKRKCAWLLNNGYIKCKNSGKKSRKYTVLKSDLIEFIEDSQRCPEKYVLPCGEFSAVKHNKPRQRKTGFPSSLPIDFRAWLEKECENIPDVLTVPQVIATTGYTDNAVNRWLRQGHLKSVQTQTTKIIPKLWLIDFYCSYAYTISNMSDKHIKLLQKFFMKYGGN